MVSTTKFRYLTPTYQIAKELHDKARIVEKPTPIQENTSDY